MKRHFLFVRLLAAGLLVLFTWMGAQAQEGYEWVVKPGEYERISWYGNLFKKNKKFGIYDGCAGKIILPFEHDIIIDGYGHYRAKKNSKWGVWDDKCEQLIPQVYDSINYMGNRFFCYSHNVDNFEMRDNKGSLLKKIPIHLNISILFREEYFRIGTGNKGQGVMDSMGNVILSPQFDTIFRYNRIMTCFWAQDKKGKLFIDRFNSNNRLYLKGGESPIEYINNKNIKNNKFFQET